VRPLVLLRALATSALRPIGDPGLVVGDVLHRPPLFGLHQRNPDDPKVQALWLDEPGGPGVLDRRSRRYPTTTSLAPDLHREQALELTSPLSRVRRSRLPPVATGSPDAPASEGRDETERRLNSLRKQLDDNAKTLVAMQASDASPWTARSLSVGLGAVAATALLLSVAWWILAAGVRLLDPQPPELSVVVDVEGDNGLRCLTSARAEVRGGTSEVSSEIERFLDGIEQLSASDGERACPFPAAP